MNNDAFPLVNKDTYKPTDRYSVRMVGKRNMVQDAPNKFVSAFYFEYVAVYDEINKCFITNKEETEKAITLCILMNEEDGYYLNEIAKLNQ